MRDFLGVRLVLGIRCVGLVLRLITSFIFDSLDLQSTNGFDSYHIGLIALHRYPLF